MNLSSHSLFHFTRSKKSLQAILLGGLRCSPIGETIPGSTLRYVVDAICFCDIPLSAISKHLEWYGPYGIGLTPAYGKSIGATPVCYVHSASRYLYHHKDKESFYKQCPLTPYLKRTCGKQHKYNCHNYYWKNFYDEKEWRAVKPDEINLYNKEEVPNLRNLKRLIDDDKSSRTNKDYYYTGKIPWNNIEYIILPTRDDVSGFVKWMNSNSIPQDLQTRIIVVEQLMKDF